MILPSGGVSTGRVCYQLGYLTTPSSSSYTDTAMLPSMFSFPVQCFQSTALCTAASPLQRSRLTEGGRARSQHLWKQSVQKHFKNIPVGNPEQNSPHPLLFREIPILKLYFLQDDFLSHQIPRLNSTGLQSPNLIL